MSPAWSVPVFAFLGVNLSFGPLAVITLFRDKIAESFGVSPLLLALLYGAYFIIACAPGMFGRSLNVGLRIRLVSAAFAILLGSLICASTYSFMVLVLSFGALVSLVGGSPFMAPVALSVGESMPYRPALASAIATLGQLTAFGFWREVLGIAGAMNDWRAAFGVVGWIAGICLLPLALGLGRPLARTAMPRNARAMSATSRPLPLALLGCGVIAVAGTLMITTLPRWDLESRPDWAKGVYILAFSSIVGRIAFALSFDRGVRTATVVMPSVLLALSAPVIAYREAHPALYVVGVFLLGSGYGGLLPVAIAKLRNLYPFTISGTLRQIFYCVALGVAVGAVFSAEAIPLQLTVALLPGAGFASTIGLVSWLIFLWATRSNASRL